jgi:hypothetical protein
MKFSKIFLLTLALLFSLGAAAAELWDLPKPLPDDPNAPQPPPPIAYSLGSGDTPRFGDSQFSFYPRNDMNRVLKMRITGFGNNITIKNFQITYYDIGSPMEEQLFEGTLGPGQVKEIVVPARQIYGISVTAAAGYFWKKPGSFQVDVLATR